MERRLMAESLASDANGLASWQTRNVGWALGGNASTSTSAFLGTTDNRTMRIRTNNVERMLIDSGSNVVIANAKSCNRAISFGWW